jgi:anaerobic selenocysteine-containing dehydrogenase
MDSSPRSPETRPSGLSVIRKTICSICNPTSHCGIDAHVRDGVIVKVEGTKENPHSEGTLCSKGAASRQYVYHKDRILTPLIRKQKGSGQFSLHRGTRPSISFPKNCSTSKRSPGRNR